MNLSEDLDLAAVSRSLALIGERSEDLVDAFLERKEDVLLPPKEEGRGILWKREEGLAIRLLREDRSWMASRDRLDGESFAEALRQVARVRPPTGFPVRPWVRPPQEETASAPEILRFPNELERQIRGLHAAFPYRLQVARKRRRVQVVGPRLIPDPELETYYGVEVAMPWCRFGTLFAELGPTAAARLAKSLVALFEGREAPAVEENPSALVLGPAATAVLLHEAVAHALEVDVAALAGEPESWIGRELGSSCLDVLDDPGNAFEGIRRKTDDEGIPVLRRWLLRSGIVEQLLADRLGARGSATIAAGAGRRSHRHALPDPRSFHLELLPGGASQEELLAGAAGGLFYAEAEAGRLQPASERVTLRLRAGRRIGPSGLERPVGPFELHAPLAKLLHAVSAVGAEPVASGAGWCAKGGAKLPVWATCPAIRLEGWS